MHLFGCFAGFLQLGHQFLHTRDVLVRQSYDHLGFGFPYAKTAVLAYAQNFPDGRSGGCLACSMDAPLILTISNVMKDVAAAYVQEMGINGGAVLGGTSLISDAAVNDIFRLS